jgi:hypothetical protein
VSVSVVHTLTTQELPSPHSTPWFSLLELHHLYSLTRWSLPVGQSFISNTPPNMRALNILCGRYSTAACLLPGWVGAVVVLGFWKSLCTCHTVNMPIVVFPGACG